MINKDEALMVSVVSNPIAPEVIGASLDTSSEGLIQRVRNHELPPGSVVYIDASGYARSREIIFADMPAFEARHRAQYVVDALVDWVQPIVHMGNHEPKIAIPAVAVFGLITDFSPQQRKQIASAGAYFLPLRNALDQDAQRQYIIDILARSRRFF